MAPLPRRSGAAAGRRTVTRVTAAAGALPRAVIAAPARHARRSHLSSSSSTSRCAAGGPAWRRAAQQDAPRCLPPAATDGGSASTTTTTASTTTASNGQPEQPPPQEPNNGGSNREAAAPPAPLAGSPTLTYAAPSSSQQFWTSFKLAFARPWRRFKKDSVLAFKLEGEVPDQLGGFFNSTPTVPAICSALQKAALDPRVKGVCIEIGPLAAGWAKVQEVRRYLDLFRQSGKYAIAYMKIAGEKEYYLATACSEVYMPPSGSLSLRGFSVAGTFLRGALDKAGVTPEVRRIGAYKSAGDQLLRKDMSAEQKEALDAILDDIYGDWVATVAAARGKTREEVEAMLSEGIFDMQRFKEGGWLTDLKYEDEIIEDLKSRTGGKPDEVAKVGLRKYASVSPSAFGLAGKKRIVVLRTSGAILGKASSSGGGSITPDGLVPKLRSLAKDKSVAAVVLRVDSPGGDALASDLMWREIKKLGEKKPVIASMGDVAASGGYYLSMAAQKIVAEALTLTGSIGVVTGKVSLGGLFEKVGYAKTVLSRGRYAEILSDARPFSEDESELFDRAAQHAYESFRDKAAASRGMEVERMQAVAQGRVWTGKEALERGLVDAIGGVARAVALAKQAAGIPEEEQVTVVEVGRAQKSPLALLTGASAAAAAPLVLAALVLRGCSPSEALAAMVGAAAIGANNGGVLSSAGPSSASSAAGAMLGLLGGGSGGGFGASASVPELMLQPGRPAYVVDGLDLGSLVGGSGSLGLGAAGGAVGSSSSSGGSSFLGEEDAEGPLQWLDLWGGAEEAAWM